MPLLDLNHNFNDFGATIAYHSSLIAENSLLSIFAAFNKSTPPASVRSKFTVLAPTSKGCPIPLTWQKWWSMSFQNDRTMPSLIGFFVFGSFRYGQAVVLPKALFLPNVPTRVVQVSALPELRGLCRQCRSEDVTQNKIALTVCITASRPTDRSIFGTIFWCEKLVVRESIELPWRGWFVPCSQRCNGVFVLSIWIISNARIGLAAVIGVFWMEFKKE
jgi:hypothetical protein